MEPSTETTTSSPVYTTKGCNEDSCGPDSFCLECFDSTSQCQAKQGLGDACGGFLPCTGYKCQDGLTCTFPARDPYEPLIMDRPLVCCQKLECDACPEGFFRPSSASCPTCEECVPLPCSGNFDGRSFCDITNPEGACSEGRRCVKSPRDDKEGICCDTVEPICPENMQFTKCGSPCPRTCENKDESIECIKLCIEGCQCMDGYVLKDSVCVPVEQCEASSSGSGSGSGSGFGSGSGSGSGNTDCGPNSNTQCSDGQFCEMCQSFSQGSAMGSSPEYNYVCRPLVQHGRFCGGGLIPCFGYLCDAGLTCSTMSFPHHLPWPTDTPNICCPVLDCPACEGNTTPGIDQYGCQTCECFPMPCSDYQLGHTCDASDIHSCEGDFACLPVGDPTVGQGLCCPTSNSGSNSGSSSGSDSGSGSGSGSEDSTTSSNSACAPNMHFTECGSPCPKTCDNLNEHPPCVSVCVVGCECDEGFVLHDGECIEVSECPGQSICGENMIYTECGSPCPRTCENMNDDITCIIACVAGCECAPGYVLRDYDCVLPEECQITSTPSSTTPTTKEVIIADYCEMVGCPYQMYCHQCFDYNTNQLQHGECRPLVKIGGVCGGEMLCSGHKCAAGLQCTAHQQSPYRPVIVDLPLICCPILVCYPCEAGTYAITDNYGCPTCECAPLPCSGQVSGFLFPCAVDRATDCLNAGNDMQCMPEPGSKQGVCCPAFLIPSTTTSTTEPASSPNGPITCAQDKSLCKTDEYCLQCFGGDSFVGTCNPLVQLGDVCGGFLACYGYTCASDLTCTSTVTNPYAPLTPDMPLVCCPKITCPACPRGKLTKADKNGCPTCECAPSPCNGELFTKYGATYCSSDDDCTNGFCEINPANSYQGVCCAHTGSTPGTGTSSSPTSSTPTSSTPTSTTQASTMPSTTRSTTAPATATMRATTTSSTLKTTTTTTNLQNRACTSDFDCKASYFCERCNSNFNSGLCQPRLGVGSVCDSQKRCIGFTCTPGLTCTAPIPPLFGYAIEGLPNQCCPSIVCDVNCPNGFTIATDSQGCPTCNCAPKPCGTTAVTVSLCSVSVNCGTGFKCVFNPLDRSNGVCCPVIATGVDETDTSASSSASSTDKAAIAGGVIGGIIGMIVLITIIAVLVSRSNRKSRVQSRHELLNNATYESAGPVTADKRASLMLNPVYQDNTSSRAAPSLSSFPPVLAESTDA